MIGRRSKLVVSLAVAVVSLPAAAADNWPSFRGLNAAGVAAAGQELPLRWDAETGRNIRWRLRVPGLAHSSPVVWSDRLFVTSAVSSRGDATFKPGLYGDGDASDDRSVQRWTVVALDKNTGSLLWEQTAYEGEPREKRHIKSTYASATPATDGRYVAAFFGSQGLYVYTVEGTLVWSRDLGRLDVGAYDAPSYEWGPASSPVLWNDRLIVQCDTGVFDCYDLESGTEIYRERIAHGGSGFSASPVAADGRIYLSSEDGQVFVVRAGPEHEILAENELGEPIMATPAISSGILYVRARDHLWAISKSEVRD